MANLGDFVFIGDMKTRATLRSKLAQLNLGRVFPSPPRGHKFPVSLGCHGEVSIRVSKMYLHRIEFPKDARIMPRDDCLEFASHNCHYIIVGEY